jgi:NAD(P)-dependent dehydrogenase (short-subunit alcohol dehydrogenase family)
MSGLRGLMEGRVVLVTGAGAGVGRGVSAAFGSAGAIVGIGVRRPEAAEETAADAGGLPDYCQQVTGEALATIAGDVRGTADKDAVYAVKAENAPDFGSFARDGLYFVAVPTSGADAGGEPADAVPVLAV